MYIYIYVYIYICIYICIYMVVSINGGSPKWFVYRREIPLKWII